MGKERRFSREFKLAALARMAAGENVSALARELRVPRKYLYQWRGRHHLDRHRRRATTLFANASYHTRFDGGGYAYSGKVGVRLN